MEEKQVPKKKKKVPQNIQKLIDQTAGQEVEILAFSPTDMNEDCEYADGYVVLSKDSLYIITSSPVKDEARAFKGYLSKYESERSKDRDWKIYSIPEKNIKKISIEPQVACGLLIVETNDGIEKTAAVFSNLYRKTMFTLSREFEHLPTRPKPEFEGNGGPGGHHFSVRPGGFGGPGGPGGPRGGRGGDDEDDIYCPKCGMMYPNPHRKVCPRCANRGSTFFRVLKFFKPYIPKIVIMFVIYFIIAGLNLVWPYLNGEILYDNVLARDPKFLEKLGLENGEYAYALFLVVLTMFAARLTNQILNIIQGVFNVKISVNVVNDIKQNIFDAMGKLSISFFKSRQTGSLMTRVLNDAGRVTGFFLDGIPSMFINTFTLIATFITMFLINWQMALAALILMPIAFIYAFKIRPLFWNAFGHRHRAERSVNSTVNDNLNGARVVKAFGQEGREETRFSGYNKKLLDSEMSIVRISNRNSIVFNITHTIANSVIWILGAFFILQRHEMEIGIMITFIGYVGELNGPMNFYTWVFRWFADSMNAAQRMFEIIDAIPEIVEDEEPVAMEKPKGEIVLKDVTFGYEINRPVLKNINLTIPAGSMLGIVGRSGAGKTTLVNLISRMYDPQEGSIYLDGVDIKNISFKDLRRNVAMVSQETYIFMGTIEENIAYAKPNASKSEIIRAAKLAGAHDFILRTPDGYNTVVGSSGRQLSGGERQRISIARAILADPKILILDEATASVDTETERAIQTSINYLVKDRTTISIAHRLSTLRDADFLCVLDNGEITERGTHKELQELKGTYFKLMELQTKALALRD